MFVEPGSRPAGSPDPDRASGLGLPPSTVFGPNRYGVKTELQIRHSASNSDPSIIDLELTQHYFDRESGQLRIVIAENRNGQSALVIRLDSAKTAQFYRAFSPSLGNYDRHLSQIAFSIVEYFQENNIEDTLDHLKGISELREEEYQDVRALLDSKVEGLKSIFCEIVNRWQQIDRLEINGPQDRSEAGEPHHSESSHNSSGVSVLAPDKSRDLWDADAFRRISKLTDEQKQHEGITVPDRVIRSHKFDNGSSITLMKGKEDLTLVIALTQGEQEVRLVFNAKAGLFRRPMAWHNFNKAFKLLSDRGPEAANKAALLCNVLCSDSPIVYCSGAVHDISEECVDTLANGGATPHLIGIPIRETIRDILSGREIIHLALESNNYAHFSSVLIRLGRDGSGIISLKNKLGAELEVNLDPSENTPYRSYELRQIMAELLSDQRRAVQHFLSSFSCTPKHFPLRGRAACEAYDRGGEICASHSQLLEHISDPHGLATNKKRFCSIVSNGKEGYIVTLKNLHNIDLEFVLHGSKVVSVALCFDRWWGERTRYLFEMVGDERSRDEAVWQLIRLFNFSDARHTLFSNIKSSKIFIELGNRAKFVDALSQSTRSSSD